MDPCLRNWPLLNNWLKKIPKTNQMDLNETLNFEYADGFYISKEDLIYNEITKILQNSPEELTPENNFEEPGPSKKAVSKMK